MTTRRDFLMSSTAFAGVGLFGSSLHAAMKYDKRAVLDLFRLRAADTDARVRAGIEANRKGSFLFSFVGKDGKALESVRVRLRQKTHDFRYGADLFMLDEISDSKAKNEAYKAHFAELFNLATCPFYWTGLEPEEGKTRYAKDATKLYRRPAPDLCLDWCEQRGIEPKAHILNYTSQTPEWAVGDARRERMLLVKRFRELSERYAQRVRMWEVTNETLWGADFTSPTTGDLYRSDDLVEWSFRTAERFFPGNELIINEAHCRVWNDPWFQRSRSPYYMQIERALRKGARIDAVGLQFHMFHGTDQANVAKESKTYYDPQRLFDVLETYATLGKPLQITEITVPAYSEDPGDEAVQAEILRELYRIWFSARGMEAIIYWNLPDGYAAYAEPGDFSKGENLYYGGLCRFDMSPKPAYHAIRELFEKEWRTNVDAEATGRYVFRGFYGTYEAEFTAKGQTVRQEIHLSRERLPDVKVELPV